MTQVMLCLTLKCNLLTIEVACYIYYLNLKLNSFLL